MIEALREIRTLLECICIGVTTGGVCLLINDLRKFKKEMGLQFIHSETLSYCMKKNILNSLGELEERLTTEINENQSFSSGAIQGEFKLLTSKIDELEGKLKNEVKNAVKEELILPPKDKQFIILPVTEEGKIISDGTKY